MVRKTSKKELKPAPDPKLVAYKRKRFVLDTNVLMHDPTAIFRFAEHDVFIPMVVLEELDRCKKGPSEAARSARQASRFMNDLVARAGLQALKDGIPLPSFQQASSIDSRCSGRLYFETEVLVLDPDVKNRLPQGIADNMILSTTLALSKSAPMVETETQVILVTKDINVQIKAAVLGICVEDYSNDKVLDDVNLLYSGMFELPADFWETHFDGHSTHPDKDTGRAAYTVKGPLVSKWYPNEFLYLPGDPNFEAMVKWTNGDTAEIVVVENFYNTNTVWGVAARNKEQNFALNVLMDPDIDLVVLLGVAGTGKTLLAMAAGATQTFEENKFREVIISRDLIPMGEEIGFLPGNEEQKMTPWMGAVTDNLEHLAGSHAVDEKNTRSGQPARRATDTSTQNWQMVEAGKKFLMSRIKIRAITFFRGRTFVDRYLIIDECQNLAPKTMKSIITRAGPGTKIICLGNLGQIDTPYLSATTSGLTYVIDRTKDWKHSAIITLQKGERSRLADFANDAL